MSENTMAAPGADERRTSTLTAEELAKRWQVQTSHVYRLTRCDHGSRPRLACRRSSRATTRS
jgi:hypothetical protein